MENGSIIKTFKDLEVWREGHGLTLLIYEMTKDFPKQEVYGLTSQMRRAAVSITSNIAEGFSRASYKEKGQFYSIAHGSLTELESQLVVARDTRFIDTPDFDKVQNKISTVHKLLNAFLRKTRELSS